MAIHNKHTELVEFILSLPGINPIEGSGSGWSPMQEALASGVPETVGLVFKKVQAHGEKLYQERLEGMVKALTEIPDFYAEVEWGVSCWIPFVSRFCPSDRYKIWKKGQKLRMDTSLLGFENMQWLRGHISFVLHGDNRDNIRETFYVIDHNRKIVEQAIQDNPDTTQNPNQIKLTVEQLMKQEIVQTSTQEQSVNPGAYSLLI
uniref:Ankyrin repeat domain-containing protein n=2 Tax=Arcella intermedia TaxID=1963864 RepID=A0A6B2LGQ8_9EUKA